MRLRDVPEGYVYGPNGVLLSQRVGAYAQRWTHDEAGRLVRYEDNKRGLAVYVYDEAGNLTLKELRTPYSPPGTRKTTRVEYTYDKVGRLLSEQCSDGTSLSYSYTEETTYVTETRNGRTTTTGTGPHGEVSHIVSNSKGVLLLRSNTYRPDGSLISTITTTPSVTREDYYTRAGVLYKRLIDGQVVYEVVELSERCIGVHDHEKNQLTLHVYDARGNNIETTVKQLTSAGAGANVIKRAKFRYDGEGNLVGSHSCYPCPFPTPRIKFDTDL